MLPDVVSGGKGSIGIVYMAVPGGSLRAIQYRKGTLMYRGELVHTEVQGPVTYRTYIQQDDTEVKGNALASGDDDLDASVEAEIIARLDSGDTWAWALVFVEASVEGCETTGGDYLGACCYKNTADFINPGGYYNDMKSEALRYLKEQLYVAGVALGKLEGVEAR